MHNRVWLCRVVRLSPHACPVRVPRPVARSTHKSHTYRLTYRHPRGGTGPTGTAAWIENLRCEYSGHKIASRRVHTDVCSVLWLCCVDCAHLGGGRPQPTQPQQLVSNLLQSPETRLHSPDQELRISVMNPACPVRPAPRFTVTEWLQACHQDAKSCVGQSGGSDYVTRHVTSCPISIE
jgi:hypothetical protein